MDSSFLERMNTLLANGEVPGLFEGDEYSALLNLCKEGAQRQGQMLDSNDELYKWFTIQVERKNFIKTSLVNMKNLFKGYEKLTRCFHDESKRQRSSRSSINITGSVQSLCSRLVWRLVSRCVLPRCE